MHFPAFYPVGTLHQMSITDQTTLRLRIQALHAPQRLSMFALLPASSILECQPQHDPSRVWNGPMF